MKALVWMGKRKVEVQRVEDPKILSKPRLCDQQPGAVFDYPVDLVIEKKRFVVALKFMEIPA